MIKINSMSPKACLLVLCLVVVVSMTVFTLWPESGVKESSLPRFKEKLAGDELQYWLWEDRPLSESQDLLDLIDEILKFDEGIYRIYSNGDTVVSLWLAYWHPGKVDYQAPQFHVPEVCWAGSGWQFGEKRNSYTLQLGNGREFISGKYRRATKEDTISHIIFWHLAGDVNFKVSTESWELVKNIQTMRQMGFGQPKEQYFIRISSNRPFDELKGDSDFQKILESVAQFGLWKVE